MNTDRISIIRLHHHRLQHFIKDTMQFKWQQQGSVCVCVCVINKRAYVCVINKRAYVCVRVGERDKQEDILMFVCVFYKYEQVDIRQRQHHEYIKNTERKKNRARVVFFWSKLNALGTPLLVECRQLTWVQLPVETG